MPPKQAWKKQTAAEKKREQQLAKQQGAEALYSAREAHQIRVRDAMYPWLGDECGRFEMCIQIAAVNAENAKYEAGQLKYMREKREKCLRSMMASGLTLKRLPASNDDEKTFILVGAPKERFLLEADRIDMEKKYATSMRVKTETGWVDEEEILYREFEMDKSEDFLWHADYHAFFKNAMWMAGKENIRGIFSTTERQRMISRILSDPYNLGGCFIDMETSTKVEKIFEQYFNMHHQTWLQLLNEVWINGGVSPPIDTVRDYFGEKVAFYFAFLAHYTKSLMALSVIGVPFFLVQAVSGDPDHSSTVFYCVMVNVWFTFFISYWKQTQTTLCYRWDMLDFAEDEEPRPNFYRASGIEMKVGFQTETGFVEVDTADYEGLKPEPYFPNDVRLARQWMGYFLTFLFMIIGGSGNVCFMVLKLHLQDELGSKLGLFCGMFFAVGWVTGMNMTWLNIAKALTEWETHRTESQFEDSLIVKTFAFQFVNSYSSFFYVAFLKAAHFRFNPNAPLYNVAGELTRDFCRDDDCVKELYKQLAIYLVCQEGMRNFKGTVMPKIKRKVLNMKMKMTSTSTSANVLELANSDKTGKSKTDILKEQVMIEATLPDYDGTYAEYAEMVIQSGFVTLFAVAFPLAPFLCLCNNLIERKTDGLKLIKLTKKPKYQAAAGIGSFVSVFQMVSLACVVTNMLIMLVSSSALCDWVICEEGVELHAGHEDITLNKKFFVCVVVEHILIIFKLILRMSIPDTTADVKDKVVMKAFQEAYEDQLKDVGLHAFQRVEVSDTEFQNLQISVDHDKADKNTECFQTDYGWNDE